MALESRPRAEVQNVQALRGLAATLVVLSHVAQHEADVFSAPHYLLPWKYVGPTGVDLFFAISGFIMVITNWHAQGTRAPFNFLVRRLIRIFPLYWIVTAVVVAAGVLFHVGSLSPYRLALSLLLVPQSTYPPVGVAWSLIYEMYFYYIFAVALFFRRSVFAWYIAAWAGLTIVLNLVIHPHVQSGALVRTLLSPFNVEFVFGVVIGLLTVYRRLVWAWGAAVLGAIASALALYHLAAIHGMYSGAPYGGWDRVLFAGVPLALLLYGMVALELRNKAVLPRLICTYGNASYSLYLWHELVSSVYFKIFGRVFAPHNTATHVAYLACVLVFTIGTSLVLYALIERPITFALQNWWRRHRAHPAPAVTAT